MKRKPNMQLVTPAPCKRDPWDPKKLHAVDVVFPPSVQSGPGGTTFTLLVGGVVEVDVEHPWVARALRTHKVGNRTYHAALKLADAPATTKKKSTPAPAADDKKKKGA